MPDPMSIGSPIASDLTRLHAAISTVLEDVDRLELRMTGIHLSNALHSIEDELEKFKKVA